MICRPCRNKNHILCKELARQNDPRIGETEKAGGQLCDCQHNRKASIMLHKPQPGTIKEVEWHQGQGLMPASVPAACIVSFLMSTDFKPKQPGEYPTHNEIIEGVRAAHDVSACTADHGTVAISQPPLPAPVSLDQRDDRSGSSSNAHQQITELTCEESFFQSQEGQEFLAKYEHESHDTDVSSPEYLRDLAAGIKLMHDAGACTAPPLV